KKGVFMMAIEAGAPIVPVSISGATKIMPKGDLAVHPGRIRITFHDPIFTQGSTPTDRETIMAAVRAAIVAGLTREEWPFDPGGLSAVSTAGADRHVDGGYSGISCGEPAELQTSQIHGFNLCVRLSSTYS